MIAWFSSQEKTFPFFILPLYNLALFTELFKCTVYVYVYVYVYILYVHVYILYVHSNTKQLIPYLAIAFTDCGNFLKPSQQCADMLVSLVYCAGHKGKYINSIC